MGKVIVTKDCLNYDLFYNQNILLAGNDILFYSLAVYLYGETITMVMFWDIVLPTLTKVSLCI